MNVLGVDASSSSTGLALTCGEELVAKAVWRPPPGRLSDGQRLLVYEKWIFAQIAMFNPDMAVVEYLAVMRGAKVIRVLSHFEGVTLLVLAKHDIITLQGRAGQARNIVLGLPVTVSKEEALDEVRRRWPRINFGVKGRGAEDVADAFVQALAHKTLAQSG